MPDTPKHSVSVAGIVVDHDDRVLVIRRADNAHWEMPGGVLELNESFEDGVRREVAEETGMNVTVGELSGVYKNLARGIVALVFRCTPGTEPVHPTAEATEVRWMTRDEVEANMNPAFAVRVSTPSNPAPNSAPTTETAWSRRSEGSRIAWADYSNLIGSPQAGLWSLIQTFSPRI